jgi:hypothetical protein
MVGLFELLQVASGTFLYWQQTNQVTTEDLQKFVCVWMLE